MVNPKILGSITLAILLVSGFLAYKNKQAYQNEIGYATAEKSNTERSGNALKDLQDKHNGVTSQTEQANKDIASLTEEEDKLKRENFDLEAEEKAKAEQVAEFQGASEELAEQEAKFEKVREIGDKLSALTKEITQLDQAIAESQGALDQLTNQNGELEKDIAAMRDVFDLRSQGRSLPGLSTSIRAIYPTWGFVTLRDGDTAGVVLNSTLDVVRGGKPIGKLLVTAVEKHSASASIVPGSVAEGETLMIGDLVVSAQVADVAQN